VLEYPGGELATLLHRGEHVDHAQQRLRDFVQHLIAETAQAGDARDDVAADELASYCRSSYGPAGNSCERTVVVRWFVGRRWG
jgi:hypothetical protein